ncbi:MAG: ABC transporter ATP-binding protein [Euryarchaeota archaeon]|nr:ABC transporter ATP-binding protein [Euryarchaeota archaeon]
MNPILQIEGLKKYFPVKLSFFDSIKGKKTQYVKAVDDIELAIDEQKTLALVGESGCGKTTVGKLITRLIDPTAGSIILEGEDIATLRGEKLKTYRREVQMVYQDPFASINPRFRICDILEEPLLIHGIGESRHEREELISKALETVKITPPEDYIHRHPHMLSGGQRQRVSFARATILDPSFIVADEPVSMLDVSIRAELLDLMRELQRKEGLTYLYITHDISTSRFFAEEIAVMYLGRIVEFGKVGEVIDNPLHPYTKALLKAVPEPIPERRGEIKRLPIKGEVPSGANVPSGCRFHPRCIIAKDVCSQNDPKLVDKGNGHLVACPYA